MAAPVTPILDNFNRTESPLANGGTWAEFRKEGAAPATGATNGSVLQLAAANPSIRGALWHTTFLAGHLQVYAEVVKVGSNWLELWLAEESEAAGYSVEFVPETAPKGKYHILKNHTSVAEAAGELEAGDAIWLDYVEATGVLTVWRRHTGVWAEALKFTDGTPLKHGGKVGFAARCNTAEWELDNFGGGAVGEVPEKPADQTSTEGKAITPVVLHGTNLHTMLSKNLPAGLALTKISETEWEIHGTPSTAKAAVTVTLEPESEGGGGASVAFKWTVEAPEKEPAPTINKPANQVSTFGIPITPVTVTGTRMHTLVEALLPPGIHARKISETEWVLEGTPTTSELVYGALLEVKNAEGVSAEVEFRWQINAPQPILFAAVNRQTVDMCVRAEVLDGVWETFGVDRAVKVMPETLVYSGNEWGPEKASFVLKRNPWAQWPDLSPYTPIEIEIGGEKTWEGRTNGTPLKAGAEQQISVQCEGWQYHLDDDLYKRLYVHSALTDWKDIRSNVEAPLLNFEGAPQVQTEAGIITFVQPKGSFVIGGQTAMGVYLDLGEVVPAGTVVVVKLGESFWGGGGGVGKGAHRLYCRGAETPKELLAEAGYQEGWTAFGLEGESNTTHVATFSVPVRFICIFQYQQEASGETAADERLKITSINVFGEAAFETGNVSTLKATKVARDAVERTCPLLSSDFTQLDTAADEFSIPTLVMGNYKTARQMIEAVNAFHNWLTMIDLSRRIVFAPPTTEPLLEWGAWSGGELEDISAGEGADIYNKAVVEGAEPNGQVVETTVTATGLGEETIVDERSFRRAKAISLSNATLGVVEQKVGEAWLKDQLVTPFAGSVKANVNSLRYILGGNAMDPSLISRHVNELLRISQAIDPDTGGVGRDGRIVAYTYEHATRSATVTLGTRVDNVETLIARLGVVQEVGS